MLLAGGVVNAVLVPQIVRASKREDGGEDFTNRLLTLSFMILAGVSIIATLAAPLLVWLYSSGWSPRAAGLGHCIRVLVSAAAVLLRPLYAAGAGAQREVIVRSVYVGAGAQQRRRDRRPRGLHHHLRHQQRLTPRTVHLDPGQDRTHRRYGDPRCRRSGAHPHLAAQAHRLQIQTDLRLPRRRPRLCRKGRVLDVRGDAHRPDRVPRHLPGRVRRLGARGRKRLECRLHERLPRVHAPAFAHRGLLGHGAVHLPGQGCGRQGHRGGRRGLLDGRADGRPHQYLRHSPRSSCSPRRWR
jgi:hypothetical protein